MNKFLLLASLLSTPAYGQSAVQCPRTDTAACGYQALFGSKAFLTAVKDSLREKIDPEQLRKNSRLYDAGWAAFNLTPSQVEYAKRNNLPESYFKNSQWYLIEISQKDAALLKTFQLDLAFRAYDSNASVADFKVAILEKAQVTELPPYKLEEQIQKDAASKLPANGFVCSSEDDGLIVQATPIDNQGSFGQILDRTLEHARNGKIQQDAGTYKLLISDFGTKRPPQLPPQTQNEELKLSYVLDYAVGNPDHYQAEYIGQSASFAFRRTITGYYKIQDYCNSKNSDAAQRKIICESDPSDTLEISMRGKKWEKPACKFFEKIGASAAKLSLPK